jgi:hypothetical protein
VRDRETEEVYASLPTIKNRLYSFCNRINRRSCTKRACLFFFLFYSIRKWRNDDTYTVMFLCGMELPTSRIASVATFITVFQLWAKMSEPTLGPRPDNNIGLSSQIQSFLKTAPDDCSDDPLLCTP